MIRNSMYVIGLTGGIASGKSMASQAIRDMGVKVWDADYVSREIVQPQGQGWLAIQANFGEEFFNEDGSLRRRELAEHIFQSPSELQKLNRLLHPIILDNMHYCLDVWENEGEKLVVVDAPLLFETGIEASCDEVWVTSCGIDEQIRRIMKRDQLTEEQALTRIRAQMPDVERKKRAQRVIDTLGPKGKNRQFIQVLIEEKLDEL